MFGPLEGCNIPVEDYYIQGITKDGKLYIGSKTGTVNADKTSTGSKTATGSKELVKLNISMQDGPNHIVVVSDELYNLTATMPTMIEYEGFFVNVGLYDENRDTLVVDLLRDVRKELM